MTETLVTAVVAAVTTALLAALKGHLSSRAAVATEVRERRFDCYPQLWKMTSSISIWPRTDVTFGNLERLHLALRRWYYESGGLYMSENARDRYGELQKLLAGMLANQGTGHSGAQDRLSEAAYGDLEDTCSALRGALAEDLETRTQRTMLRSIRLAKKHRSQRRRAEERITAADSKQEARARHELEDWQKPGGDL